MRLVRTLLALLVMLAVPISSRADTCPNVNSPVSPLSYQQMTVSSTAVSPTVPRESKMFVMDVETNPIRYLDTGDTPTSTFGKPRAAGQSLVVCGAAQGSFKMIRSGASDATVNILYYG